MTTRSGLTIASSDTLLSEVTQATVDGIRLDTKLVAVGQVQDALGVYTRFDFPRGGGDIDAVYIIDDDTVVSPYSVTNYNVTISNPGGTPGYYNGKVGVLGTLYEARLDLNRPFVRVPNGEIDFGAVFYATRSDIRYIDSGAFDVKHTPRAGASAITSSFSPTSRDTGRFRAFTSGPPETIAVHIISENKDRVQVVAYTQHGIRGEA